MLLLVEGIWSIFFYLEKAYDTTWRHGVLLDLYKMGLRDCLSMFICDFLSDRNFKVRVGNIYNKQISLLYDFYYIYM